MMEMDDTFPEFKTQWLNETLKFIKNDKELIYKYPEWPISRVKFYHALIAQRQLNAGLGFKTLYAPLWEAMKVFGLKYNFKVTIVNSKDEEKGCLVLEKIPIKTEEDTETDSEEESTCKQKLTKKMEQAYLLNKAIVERNSPTFIKNTLQSFLGFVIDEASASIDFKDLAPIEAKFIQNIQAIHDQKVLFYKIFSPSAIEILKKISTSLSLLKNTYNIKVGNVRTNSKTAKREITLTKEPNFGYLSSPLPSTMSSASPTNKKVISKPMSAAPLRTPKNINPKPIPSFQCVSSHVDVSKTKPKEIDKETLNCKIKKEKQKANDKEIKETFEYKTGRQAKSRLINVEDIYNNKTGKETSPTNANKIVNKIDCKINDKSMEEKKIMHPENDGKSTKIPEKVHGKAKDPAPADSNGRASLTRSGQNRAMMEAMSKPLESDKGLRMMKLMGWEGGALGLRGDGIVEPITPALHLKPKAGLGAPPVKISNKENKTEPKTKKGTKEIKNSITRFQFLEGVYEALDKGNSIIRFKSSLNTREVRFYINNILDLNRQARVSHNCQNEKSMVDKILDKLHKMPDKMFDYSFMHNASELCLKVINKTNGVSMPQPIAPKVHSKTDGVCVPQPITPKVFNKTEGISMSQPIAPKAGTKTELPEKLFKIDNYLRSTTGKPERKKASVCKLSVKLYTLLMVAYFVESDDIDMNMDFSFGYCKKVYQYMQCIRDVLNEGKQTNKIKSEEEVELLNKISESLKDSFLSVHLSSPHVTVRKIKLSSKHRQMIDYNQFFNIPTNDKTNNENGDSESDSENKAKIDDSIQKPITEPNIGKKLDETINNKVKIDDSIQKLITEPSNGKKLDEAINCTANIDDSIQKVITEPSNGKQLDEAINYKANIDDSIQKLITEPSNGKKLDKAINCKAKIDDSIQKLITEPSNGKKLNEAINYKAKIDDRIKKLITEPSNNKNLDEAINSKSKIDDNIQKLIMEPRNSKKLHEALNLNKNTKQLHENRDIDTNQFKFNFEIKNDTEDKIHDMDEKIIEKRKEKFGQDSQSENEPIETDNKNFRDKFIDLIQRDLNNKDFNDNVLNSVLNSNIPSEIKSTSQSCDTNSLKNNIEMDEVQKDIIDVLEYKEYSILKIVLQDWEDLDNLSRKIQESIMNYDYYYEDNYLKCHGIQNGGLVYYCSNEDWFKDILNKNFNANYSLKTIENFKMKVHINSFIQVEYVLKAFELYNRGLCTTDWTVLEEGNCYFVVDVDYDSFQFVCNQRFSLFAGVDTASITIVL